MERSIARIQQGDERAFKELFNELYQALCAFASTYVKDDALAADIVQEGFVKYWNRRGDFDDYFRIKSFLYIVVKNDCLNAIRDMKLKREDVSILESHSFFTDTVLEEETYRIFYRAIESLPKQTKEIIQQTLDGKRNAEIAENLGIAESSVHSLKKIAYKKLRSILKNHYYLIYLYPWIWH